MHAQRSNSFIISLTLHASVTALLFLATYLSALKKEDPIQVFELVAGDPTDIYATEAPKLGNTTSAIKIEIPDLPDAPDFAPEEPIPVVQTLPEPEPPAPQEKTPPKQTPKETPKKEAPKTQPKTTETKKTEATPKTQTPPAKVSYQDFLKNNPIKTPTKTSTSTKSTPRPVKKIDVEGIVGGVVGGSAANKTGGGGGQALSRAEADKLEVYISMLVAAIDRVAKEEQAGLSDELLARVRFDISASGQISNVRIAVTSGSREFDNFALKVFRKVRPLGPTPTGKAYTWTIAFTMDPNA